MSKPTRRRGGRSGASTRVANEVTLRVQRIRAVWCAVHNDPNHTVSDLAAEFYYTVGEILDGRELSALIFRKIDRARVMAHAEE